MSRQEFEAIIPVKPPIENIIKKPIDQYILILKLIWEFMIVENHLKILIPVGIAIIMVAAVK